MKKQFITKKLLKENLLNKEKVIVENFANSFNKIKRVEESPISQKFLYGDIISVKSSCGNRSGCGDSYCEVEIITEKDGNRFLNIILCLDIDVTLYNKGYSASGWDPGDPGDLEYNIMINQGTIEDNEKNFRELTDEEITMLESDQFLIRKLKEKLDDPVLTRTPSFTPSNLTDPRLSESKAFFGYVFGPLVKSTSSMLTGVPWLDPTKSNILLLIFAELYALQYEIIDDLNSLSSSFLGW